MRLTASQLAVHDVAKVAVLAALNFADELEVLKDSFERELSALLISQPEEEDYAEPQSSEAQASVEETRTDASLAEDQAWFDSIFDPETTRGGERLSTQVSSRLKSHVSARLRRLRQPTTKTSITEDTGGER